MTNAAEFGTNVWTVEGMRVRWWGVPFERRMTVVRLSDGGLWIHSPVQPTEEIFSCVDRLGPVRHIVAPNKFHDRYLDEWLDHFPEAQFWSCPGFAQANQHIKHAPRELTDDAPAPWNGEIEHRLIAGDPLLTEIVFYHRLSKTLIVTDVIQNHDPQRDGFFVRLLKRLGGIEAPRGGSPVDWRLTLRDRSAARTAVRQVLQWDFDRLIVCHGLCVTSDARPFVKRAFAWLKPTASG